MILPQEAWDLDQLMPGLGVERRHPSEVSPSFPFRGGSKRPGIIHP